mgnify:CR=1 FL=1
MPSGVVKNCSRDERNDGSFAMYIAYACTALTKATERKGMSAKGIGGESSMKMQSMKACASCDALNLASVNEGSFIRTNMSCKVLTITPGCSSEPQMWNLCAAELAVHTHRDVC